MTTHGVPDGIHHKRLSGYCKFHTSILHGACLLKHLSVNCSCSEFLVDESLAFKKHCADVSSVAPSWCFPLWWYSHFKVGEMDIIIWILMSKKFPYLHKYTHECRELGYDWLLELFESNDIETLDFSMDRESKVYVQQCTLTSWGFNTQTATWCWAVSCKIESWLLPVVSSFVVSKQWLYLFFVFCFLFICVFVAHANKCLVWFISVLHVIKYGWVWLLSISDLKINTINIEFFFSVSISRPPYFELCT